MDKKAEEEEEEHEFAGWLHATRVSGHDEGVALATVLPLRQSKSCSCKKKHLQPCEVKIQFSIKGFMVLCEL